MKAKNIEDLTAAKSVIQYLNFGHDACLNKIIFIKDRTYGDGGNSIVFPDNNISICKIEVNLLHNNYESAKEQQQIQFIFNNVKDFRFSQNTNYDYSMIYEIECSEGENGVNYIFYCSKNIPFLKIQSPLVAFKEVGIA